MIYMEMERPEQIMLIVFIFELLGIVKVDLFVLSILYFCVYVPLWKS